MEMSHRSPEFESINAAAEQKLRDLLGISDDYAVIFVQGGGKHAVHHGSHEPVPPGKSPWTSSIPAPGPPKPLVS